MHHALHFCTGCFYFRRTNVLELPPPACVLQCCLSIFLFLNGYVPPSSHFLNHLNPLLGLQGCWNPSQRQLGEGGVHHVQATQSYMHEFPLRQLKIIIHLQNPAGFFMGALGLLEPTIAIFWQRRGTR